MRSISVKRSRYGAKNWEVRCLGCESGDSWWVSTPWAHTPDRTYAMHLATFHVELHDLHRCDCCGHVPTIARPVAAGPGMFTIGGQPYAVTANGVRRMSVDTKEPPPKRNDDDTPPPDSTTDDEETSNV